jgi:hypothetical protein
MGGIGGYVCVYAGGGSSESDSGNGGRLGKGGSVLQALFWKAEGWDSRSIKRMCSLGEQNLKHSRPTSHDFYTSTTTSQGEAMSYCDIKYLGAHEDLPSITALRRKR